MKKEFKTLSEQDNLFYCSCCDDEVIRTKNVKEFIKIILEDNKQIYEDGTDAGISSYEELIEQINNNFKNRAGKDLI